MAGYNFWNNMKNNNRFLSWWHTLSSGSLKGWSSYEPVSFVTKGKLSKYAGMEGPI